MSPELLIRLVIRPVLKELEWPQQREREVLLTAIALQESELKHRRQMPSGPARSFWQIEGKTASDCFDRCVRVRVLWTSLGLPYLLNMYPIRGANANALEYSDLGACAIAAGILRLHPGRLPEIGDVNWAWKYYLASWRPGKPRPKSWPKAYNAALKARSNYLRPGVES